MKYEQKLKRFKFITVLATRHWWPPAGRVLRLPGTPVPSDLWQAGEGHTESLFAGL